MYLKTYTSKARCKHSVSLQLCADVLTIILGPITYLAIYYCALSALINQDYALLEMVSVHHQNHWNQCSVCVFFSPHAIKQTFLISTRVH